MIHSTAIHEPTGIEWDFPVFILVESVTKDAQGNLTFVGPKAIRLEDAVDSIAAFPVFTDDDGAKQYIEDHKLIHKVCELADPESLLCVLTEARKSVVAVVRDPLRANLKVRAIPIDALIAELQALIDRNRK
jgi:hypothetical protein